MASDPSPLTSFERQATTLFRLSQLDLFARLSRKLVSKPVLLTRSVRPPAKPSRQTLSLQNSYGSDVRLCFASALGRATSTRCWVVGLRLRRSPSLSANLVRANLRSL